MDFKFLKVQDAAVRVDEPVILWSRDSRLEKALSQGKGAYPAVDPQWVEDRFWVWMHYAGIKIGRGEYFEALEFLSFLRMQVLGSMALQKAGYDARGVRNIERLLPDFTEKLKKTVATPDKQSLLNATTVAASLYLELRKSDLCLRSDARTLAMDYLKTIQNRSS
ncbi:hypothetical protein [Endozoicomonas montiporae]|uniref:Oxalate/formate antiporter n=1 Tax=Endozoicomonas montiporae CL-33 TaxID=570277 RepID=A0A142BG37_9GAMM|nr:hypothetical protein [Endozoicomonas montiporae]AMO57713.1 oxalate/formate antiporter [Endozoicomonas montiporae CL-33]